MSFYFPSAQRSTTYVKAMATWIVFVTVGMVVMMTPMTMVIVMVMVMMMVMFLWSMNCL